MGRLVAQALDYHMCTYSGENCFKPMRCLAVVTYGTTIQTYYTPIRMKVSESCVPSCFETMYNGRSKLVCTTSCCQYNLFMALASWLPGPWPWPSYSWPPSGVCSKALLHWLQTHWRAEHRAAWPHPLPLHSPPTLPLPRPPQPHSGLSARTLDLPQPATLESASRS